MTTSVSAGPQAPDRPAGRGGEVPPEPGAGRRHRAGRPSTLIRQLIGSSLLVLSACLLGFGLWVAFASRLHYDHAQLAAYDRLRVELALGTAPVGPTQPAHPNRLLALGTPLAVLSIPAIGLRSVVGEGTTGQVLENGPGHLRYTALPGQEGVSVILGRRAAYGGPFGRLGTLNPGDAITVVTGQTTARFRVLDVRRAGDPSPPPPAAGGSRLILVTADGSPFAPTGMLYVDADLTTRPQPAPPAVLSASNLAPAENAMGTDPAAWLPLVLWGQLLLLATMGLSWLTVAWGRWPAWIVAVPVLGYVVLSAADEVTRLLPNLM